MRVVPLVVVISLMGCFLEPDVDESAVISCASDADCPEEFRCLETSNCRAFDASDDVAPGVSVDLNKLVFARGDILELTVDADEELALAPRVIIGIATLEAESFTGQRATYSLAADDDALEGTLAVEVIAEDLAGNEVRIALAIVTFDFTPPSLFEGSVRVELIASVDNPLDDADIVAIAPSTAARLTFTAVEALAQDPVIDAGANTFELEQVAGNGFSFLLASPRTDGTFPLTAMLVDLAGNRATIDLELDIVVDGTPPEAPAGLVLVRKPWGSDSEVAAVEVEVPAGLIPSGHILSLRQSQVGLEIARVGPEARTVRLPVGDVVFLDATLFDEAGNRSSLVDVVAGRWTATLAGRVVNGNENPHRVFASGGQVVSTIPSHAEELSDNGWAVARDNAGVSVTGKGEWREAVPQLGGQPTPVITTARVGPAVFDERQGGVRTLFTRQTQIGGFPPTIFDAVNNEEWVFDGGWRQIVPDNKPSPRTSSCAAYDGARDVIVVFGGQSGIGPAGSFAETYEVTDRLWQEIDASGPVARTLCTMVFDAARGVVLMAGGIDVTGTPLDDAWSFDGVNWTELSPPGQSALSGVFESRTQRTLMVVASGLITLTDQGWQPVFEHTFERARAAYDPVREEITILNDGPMVTLEHDGLDYVMTSSAQTILTQASEASLTYDPIARALLLTAGRGDEPASVLARRGDQWVPVLSNVPVDGHTQRNLFLDPDGRIVLVGGSVSFVSHINDVWTRVGHEWTEVIDSGLSPRSRAAVTGTEQGGLLFGGFNGGPNGETWTFDHLTDTWTRQFPQTAPPDRSDAALVVDDIGPILFGGFDRNNFRAQMFRYIDDDWILVGDFPEPLSDMTAVFDPTRGVIVAVSAVLDGDALIFRHFESDGANNFTDATPTQLPATPERLERPMVAFDNDRGRVIYNDGEALYRLEDGGWEPELAVNVPDRTLGGLSIYDPNSQRLVNIKEEHSERSVTWEYRAPTDERPGIVVQFDLDSTGVALQDIDTLHLSLAVIGDHRAFLIDGTNRVPLPPAVFTVEGAAVTLAPRPRSTFEVLVEPNAANGNSTVRAELDYAELEVRYTRTP